MASVIGVKKEFVEDFELRRMVGASVVSDDLIFERGDAEELNLGSLVTPAYEAIHGPSGKELRFMESWTGSADATSGTTEYVIYTQTSSFTVIDRPVWVEAEVSWVYTNAATGTFKLMIQDLAGVIKRQTYRSFASGDYDKMRVCERISTPGTYSRRLAVVRTAGTAVLNILAEDEQRVQFMMCAVEN